jgi:hypothetical protein
VLPLHDLAVGIADNMAITKLALRNEGTPTALAVAFRPGTLAILWTGERICVSLVKRRIILGTLPQYDEALLNQHYRRGRSVLHTWLCDLVYEKRCAQNGLVGGGLGYSVSQGYKKRSG